MARYLPSHGQRWLKTLHLVMACAWLGGAVSLTLIQALHGKSSVIELLGTQIAMQTIDDLVIIPGAIGCLLTGLFYSLWTRWGFFRHGWITTKWILTVAQMTYGTFWLGPWLNANVELARAQGAAASVDPIFIHNAQSNLAGGIIQACLLTTMMGLSVFKPRKQLVSTE